MEEAEVDHLSLIKRRKLLLQMAGGRRSDSFLPPVASAEKFLWRSVNPASESDPGDCRKEWPGLPRGAKFIPNDYDLLWHLVAKIGNTNIVPHPFIDEFIRTVDTENVMTLHPQNLPGVEEDGKVSYFFHRVFKTNHLCSSDIMWEKIGNVTPLYFDGGLEGFKTVFKLYISRGIGNTPETTNWTMHQFQIGHLREELSGELVVSKIFRACSSKETEWHPKVLAQGSEYISIQEIAAEQPVVEGTSNCETNGETVDDTPGTSVFHTCINTNCSKEYEFVNRGESLHKILPITPVQIKLETHDDEITGSGRSDISEIALPLEADVNDVLIADTSERTLDVEESVLPLVEIKSEPFCKDLLRHDTHVDIGTKPFGASIMNSHVSLNSAHDSSYNSDCYARPSTRLKRKKKTATDSVEEALSEDAPGLLQVLLDKGIRVEEMKLFGAIEDDEALEVSSEFEDLKAVIEKLFPQRASLFLKHDITRHAKSAEKAAYCLSCLVSLIEQAHCLRNNGNPVEWGWCRDLQSFIFIFDTHHRIALERPEYGYATYFFEIVYSLPIDWQINRLVTVMKLSNYSRMSVIENRQLMVGEDLSEGEAGVLVQYGWTPNTGLGTLLNYCDRVVHDRRNEAYNSNSDWRAKIGKVLMKGYNGGCLMQTALPSRVGNTLEDTIDDIKLENPFEEDEFR